MVSILCTSACVLGSSCGSNKGNFCVCNGVSLLTQVFKLITPVVFFAFSPTILLLLPNAVKQTDHTHTKRKYENSHDTKHGSVWRTKRTPHRRRENILSHVLCRYHTRTSTLCSRQKLNLKYLNIQITPHSTSIQSSQHMFHTT